jgi:hypothetical protein
MQIRGNFFIFLYSNKLISDQFTITLLPPLMIENLLPVELMYKVVERNTDDIQKQVNLSSKYLKSLGKIGKRSRGCSS